MVQTAIPMMQFRGGSSKGLYLKAEDLPTDKVLRDEVLLAIMGGDTTQMDGLGGGHPLTSKVAIIDRSSREDADIDYLFAQVVVGQNRVDYSQNCGNILAGVVPFVMEAGLYKTWNRDISLSVHMVNSGKVCRVTVQMKDGQVRYDGNTKIDGVCGASAPIVCEYLDTAGAICGSLLPTGNVIDLFDDVEVTCIDNGMPVIMLRASSVGISGYECPTSLNANTQLKEKLERIRLQSGQAMGLGDVTNKNVPKMCLISPSLERGLINTRTFIPHVCHESIGVLGAVSVATGCFMESSVADGLFDENQHCSCVSIEHPSGAMELRMSSSSGQQNYLDRIGLVRTARLLSRGWALIPETVWSKKGVTHCDKCGC
ncbi:MAG: 4-oxalomesaconate tautomerase [Pseudomonadota bacterium]